MNRKTTLYKFSLIATICGAISLSVIPAIAESNSTRKLIARTKHLNRLVLAAGFDRSTAIITGQTGGSYSLASIANRDGEGNHCMGYSDPEPDHTLILQDNFSKLSLKVNSGGKDTTLVIKGPNSRLRCAFGQKRQRDALISDTNWQQGKYEIWVGSMQPKRRSGYRLSVNQ